MQPPTSSRRTVRSYFVFLVQFSFISNSHLNPTEKAHTDLRRCVGMIFQKPIPFPMSVFDNVAYPLRLHFKLNRNEIRERVEEKRLDILALYQPVATDLRRVVTILKTNGQPTTDRAARRPCDQHRRGRHLPQDGGNRAPRAARRQPRHDDGLLSRSSKQQPVGWFLRTESPPPIAFANSCAVQRPMPKPPFPV